MTDLALRLSPDGGLRVVLPSRRDRHLDIPPTVAGLKALVRILKDAHAGKRDAPGYIAEFPTQAVIDAWMKGEAEAKAQAAKDKLREETGIDPDKVEFKI